jgi:hypothetical protein
MNYKWLLAVIGFIAAASPARAADPGAAPTISPNKTISGSTVITPGRYLVTVAPGFEEDMAKRLEEAVGTIAGLADVDAVSEDDTIHFTAKEGSKVRVAELQKVVGKTHTSGAISVPVLEGSLTPRLGL